MVNLLKNKTAYKITCIAVLFFIFLRPVIILFSHTDSYFARNYSTRYENFRKEYYSSQYVTKNNPGFIPDQALENFAAGAFLQGVNPIMIIHDQPPLGRYIGALSILIFDNAETINVFLIALSGLVIFLIAKLILKNTLLSLLCSAIFVNEPLFMGQFSYLPLLESTQLPFIFLTIYFFLKALGTKKPFKLFITVSVILGFVISIRFFALGVSLLAAFVVCLFLYKEQRKKILQFLVTLPLTVLVLFLSYTKTILDGTPIWHIFGIQKYIFIYHKDQISSPFSFWDLLLFNRWHTWWANRAIAHDEQWIVLWPVSVLFSALYFVYLLFQEKIPPQIACLFLWFLSYSILLSIGNVSTRYFLPFLPFLYILSCAFLKEIYEKNSK